MCKFKVGDIIRGTNRGNYMITNERMLEAKVVRVDNYAFEKDILIRIIKHEEKAYEEQHYSVNSEHFEFVEGDKDMDEKIVIRRLGKETIATYYKNGKIECIGTAKCHPDDKFDLKIGSELAIERLLADMKAKEFKPYIDCFGTSYGIIGTETNITDMIGNKLCVGDVVYVYSLMNRRLLDICVVVENNTHKGKFEILGCFGERWNNGMGDMFMILKHTGYEKFKDRDMVDDAQYILTPIK